VDKEKEQKDNPKLIKKRLRRPSIAARVTKELIITFHKPLLLIFVIGLLALILVPILTYLLFVQDLGTKERILNRNNFGLTLLDSEDKPFFSFYQPKVISFVPLSNIPKTTRDALVAAEDREFYDHPGFSIRGTIRAVVANLASKEIVQGGSTITQGLAKTTLLNADRNFLRKYQELILALELNRRYSKEDILELYLNSVYFGEGAFGIENAAQAYFGKPAKELTLSESALLIGLLPAPSAFSPLSNDPKHSERRQDLVLLAMKDQQLITQLEADAAAQAPLVYNPTEKEQINVLAPHFALMVRDELIKEYGEERIIRSGFKVKTTINSKWQEYAETAVKNQVTALRFNDVSNGAAVTIDPKTGEIKALVGSLDFNNRDFGTINMVTTARQPGSSMKPIVYADAIQSKLITAATIIDDKETTFGDGYKPKNYDGRFRGPVTVRKALANSLNIPAIKVIEQVGVSNAISFANQLGISTLDQSKDYGLPLVLGAGEVKLLELTNAFAAFANLGNQFQPISILEIKDKYGKVIVTTKNESKQVLGPNTAFIMSSILSDNIARSETFGGLLTINRPAAVKTGTTEDYRDSLTIGYTPNLVVGVWVGNNDNKPMSRIAGSTGAAPIWRLLMNNFLTSLPYETFRKPSSVLALDVCPYKGLESKEATESAYREFFLPGTQIKSCQEPSPTPGPSETPVPTNKPEEKQEEKKEEPTTTPLPTIQEPTPSPTDTQIQIIVP